MIAAERSRQALHSIFHRILSLQKSSVASSTHTVIWKPSTEAAKEIEDCYGRLDLNFENSKEAFKSKTNYELFRALFVLHLCSYETLVKNNKAILKALRIPLGQNLFNRLLRATFFGQFVAGESREEVEPTVLKMQKFGVKSILDYSVEKDISQEDVQKKALERMTDGGQIKSASLKQVVGAKNVAKTHRKYDVYKEFADRRQNVISARTYFYNGEVECDRNCDIFCQSIDAVASATGGLGFCAIKVTALGRPALLLKASESIAQTQNFFKAITGSTWENLVLSKISEKDFLQKLQDYGIKTESKMVQEWFRTVDFDEDGFVDFYDWTDLLDDNIKLSEMFQVYNIKTQKMEPLIVQLSDEEEQEFANMTDRMVRIVDYAISKGVRVMVDAEQTYFKPVISRLTMALMRRHNKERGWVFNTYQAYLKNCLRDVELDMHIARRGNFHFGCKLVRGAYMDQERKRAVTVGYEDPINPSIEATAEMYNRVLTRIVEERDIRGPGQCSVMVASHNEESTRFAVQLMKDKCIAPSEKVICFAQLFGMCDQISFSLGQAGYSVYKYVPYGPIEGVLPYLSRRAQENGALLLKGKKERKLLRNELMRRICTGRWIYNPENFTVQ
uniref:Proline dehydrogenase n=1 Tax=Parascaris univalens TaxID=6257 RepID=A0A914ZEQ6_PARUN